MKKIIFIIALFAISACVRLQEPRRIHCSDGNTITYDSLVTDSGLYYIVYKSEIPVWYLKASNVSKKSLN